MSWKYLRNSGVAVALLISITALAGKSYSPYADQRYPTHVYFGDTHLHTNISNDGFNFDGGRSPEEVYRFARGEAVIGTNGMKVRLNRPLDFLVVADHSENLGLWQAMLEKKPALLATKNGRYWQKQFDQWIKEARKSVPSGMKFILQNIPEKQQQNFWQFYTDAYDIPVGGEGFRRSVWQQVIENAERNNIPGRFTAFIGYEWSLTPRTKNKTYDGHMHRVVIFQDGADKVSQVLPFTSASYDSTRPEDLWNYFERYEKSTGGKVLAIPHNSNLSNGKMFSLEDSEGAMFSELYAKSRNRWEPLLEVTQTKGDSEAHPVLSPTDEFSDYETFSWSNSSDDRRQYEYARSALKLGLGLQARLGVNPFKFGMIGSTDSHTSLPAIEENNFWGKMPHQEPDANRIKDGLSVWKKLTKQLSPSASGYAAVWAEENTRASLFAAMRRKETYATTGPRMTIRFFGGWNYHKEDAFKSDLARAGYEKGVPMGGDLVSAPNGKSPNFLIRAVKDPDGANLDRVQVIKGWQNMKGELQEKVYNVALSDNRRPNSLGKVKPVGNTVDLADASYINSIGDPELAVVWQDPDFNKDELAFYYVRVLEIPTPRWTAYDAKFFGIKDIPEEVPMVTQERAYTSPIWYSPSEFSADNQ